MLSRRSEVCRHADRIPDQCDSEADRPEEEGRHLLLERFRGADGRCVEAKEDASELMQKKVDLEKEKSTLEASAAEKDGLLQKRLRSVGNYVHDSVHVSGTEVRLLRSSFLPPADQTYPFSRMRTS